MLGDGDGLHSRATSRTVLEQVGEKFKRYVACAYLGPFSGRSVLDRPEQERFAIRCNRAEDAPVIVPYIMSVRSCRRKRNAQSALAFRRQGRDR